MTIKEAHELLDMYYNKAITLKYIQKPLAWALYQVWQWADKEKEKKAK